MAQVLQSILLSLNYSPDLAESTLGNNSGWLFGSVTFGSLWSSLKMPVPKGIGMPIIMHSLTPATASVLEWTAASYR